MRYPGLPDVALPFMIMASSSRPRPSNTSLTPRALRTFRALTRRREAFPLRVDSGSVDTAALRLVIVGSPSRTPAELRVPLQLRLNHLRKLAPNSAVSGNRSIKFTPGATALARPLFRSPQLRQLRNLLQGGSALLEFNRDSPKTFITHGLLSSLLAEARQPIPGFKPTAYLLSLPNSGSTAGFNRNVEVRRNSSEQLPVTKFVDNPYLSMISVMNAIRAKSIALPISLSSQIGIAITATRVRPTTRPIKVLPLPMVSLLSTLDILVKQRQR